MPQKWYQKASIQAAIVAGIFFIVAAIIMGIFTLLQTSNDSNIPKDIQQKNSLVLLNLMDMGYRIYNLGLIQTSNIEDEIPDYDKGVLQETNRIRAIAKQLKLKVHSTETGVQLRDYYRNQLRTNLQKDFLNLGIDLAILNSIILLMKAHPNNHYGIEAKEKYEEIKQELNLKLIEHRLENVLEYLPTYNIENGQLIINGSVDVFIAKLKAEIRGKYE